MFRSGLLLLLPGLLQAQAAVGRLYYTTSAGRAVSLRLMDAGPGFMSLAPEQGDAGRLRACVLSRSGARNRLAPGAVTLADPLPEGWRGGAAGSNLIRTADGTIYWHHAPGQVIPVRFSFGGLTWQLLTAELPMGRVFASR